MAFNRKTPEELRAEFVAQLQGDISTAVASGLQTVDEAVRTQGELLVAFEGRMVSLEDSRRVIDLPGSSSRSNGRPGSEEFSFMRVFESLTNGNNRDMAPLEWEMHDNISDEYRVQLRALGVSPDHLGGFIVPGEVMADILIPLLRPKLIALELGADELTGLTTSPVEIPRETVAPTIEDLGENEAGTSADPEFGQLRLEPHTAQSFIRASRRFMMMGQAAESKLRRMMARELALQLNLWVLKGTGAAGQPVGILNAAGVGSVDFSGVTIGPSDVPPAFYTQSLLFEQALMDADAWQDAANLGWAVPPKFIRAARQVKTEAETAGAGISNLEMSRSMMTSGVPDRILGHNWRQSTQLLQGATAEVIFGAWEFVTLAQWGSLVLEASNVANDALQRRQTHIVAWLEADVGITYPEAFAQAADLDLATL